MLETKDIGTIMLENKILEIRIGDLEEEKRRFKNELRLKDLAIYVQNETIENLVDLNKMFKEINN